MNFGHKLPNFSPLVWVEPSKTCIDINLFGLTCYHSSDMNQLGSVGEKMKSLAEDHVKSLLVRFFQLVFPTLEIFDKLVTSSCLLNANFR